MKRRLLRVHLRAKGGVACGQKYPPVDVDPLSPQVVDDIKQATCVSCKRSEKKGG